MPRPSNEPPYRDQAVKHLQVAIVFCNDGAFLDASRAAAEAITLLLKAYGERWNVS